MFRTLRQVDHRDGNGTMALHLASCRGMAIKLPQKCIDMDLAKIVDEVRLHRSQDPRHPIPTDASPNRDSQGLVRG